MAPIELRPWSSNDRRRDVGDHPIDLRVWSGHGRSSGGDWRQNRQHALGIVQPALVGPASLELLPPLRFPAVLIPPRLLHRVKLDELQSAAPAPRIAKMIADGRKSVVDLEQVVVAKQSANASSIGDAGAAEP